MARILKNTQEIRKHNLVLGHVHTPQGILNILGLEKSCGYTTNYQRKMFKYVELPDGRIVVLRKYMLRYWEQMQWQVVWK